jgi:integrase
MPITSIKRRDVIALLDKMMKRERKHPTIHLFIALRKLFTWAAERNIIEMSPGTHVKSPIQAQKRERLLLDEEIRAVWQACDKEGAPFGTLIQFLLVTGQRESEASEMRWQEVDFKENVWRLPRERVKANRSHEVPLSSLAVQLLQSLPRFEADNGKEGEHFSFTTTGGRRPFSGFSKCKERLDKKSGVSDWRIHDLRRTCGTNLAKIGVPVSTISQVLNHAQGGVTSIYNRHSYLPEKREALEKWAVRLQEIISEKQ